MHSRNILKKQNYFVRPTETRLLKQFVDRNEAGIIVVYGRRRVGKTELIEQTFRNRNILKFEGIQGKDQAQQRKNFIADLAGYAEDASLNYLECDSWLKVFEVLSKYVKTGEWTVYLEELQWLADYQEDLVSELKYAWDNYFRYNSRLILILCGSGLSYFRTKVLRSRALYNRSSMELPVEQFSIADTSHFYPTHDLRKLFDAYLTVGGIPDYLKIIRGQDSVYHKMVTNSFNPGTFFSDEFERVFVSSFAGDKRYREILEIIGQAKLISRQEILEATNKKSGGGVSTIVDELINCGFLEEMTTLPLLRAHRIFRYRIRDYFLNFYFKFIAPQLSKISEGQFKSNPNVALSQQKYSIWLGYAFERFCRYHQARIAQILEFSGIEYQAGSLYNSQANSKTSGYQIDLAFKRSDKVLTVCEIKYRADPIGLEIISEFEEKLKCLKIPEKKQIQRVLISASGISSELNSRGYFDRIIGLDELKGS